MNPAWLDWYSQPWWMRLLASMPPMYKYPPYDPGFRGNGSKAGRQDDVRWWSAPLACAEP